MSCRLGGGMENYPISSGYSCESPSNGYAAQCSSQRHNTSNDITLRSDEITNTSSTEHMMMRNDVNIISSQAPVGGIVLTWYDVIFSRIKV